MLEQNTMMDSNRVILIRNHHSEVDETLYTVLTDENDDGKPISQRKKGWYNKFNKKTSHRK